MSYSPQMIRVSSSMSKTESYSELEGLLEESPSSRGRAPRRHLLSRTRQRLVGYRIHLFVLLAIVLLAGMQMLLFSRRATTANPWTTSYDTTSGTAASSSPKWTPSGPVADGRVVVTGGGGNIGKEIVRRLLATSTPVTVLDKIFHQDELEEILADIPQAERFLHVKLGDIRDANILREVMTDDVVGVIHLAAVSRVLWCLENEADCWDVNERGTEAVLTALTKLNKRDGGRRWFILSSSREVYGDAKVLPVMEDSELLPTNIYGASKLKAEQVVQRFLKTLEHEKDAGSLHAIVLRLSNVYGGVYDHLERLIPSIATQAISHQVIQIVGGRQNFDMLHIDDCVDGFLRAVETLTKKRQSWAIRSPRIFLDTFNLAAGSEAPVDQLVDMIIRYTRSKSPIQYIAGDDRFPNTYRGNTEKARQGLGFEAAVSIEEGVLRLIRLYLQRTEKVLTQKIASRCGDPDPSLVSHTELAKLDDCLVHVGIDQDGELASLRDSEEDANWIATRDMPLYQMRSYVKTTEDGRLLLSLRHERQDAWMTLNTTIATIAEGPVTMSRLSKAHMADGTIMEYEMEVNVRDSTIRLGVPGTSFQVVGPTTPGVRFSLVSKEADVWPFRINPICCKAPAPWPFYEDDPNDYMIGFQKTSLKRPFLGSPTKAICNRLQRHRVKIVRDLATLSTDTLQEPRRRLSKHPAEWTNAHLPSCTNSCDLPTICIDTGDCECVITTCPARQRFPFASVANLPTLSYPPSTPISDPNSNPLLEMVKRSSWKNVLRPQASRFIANGSPAKVHLAPLMPEDAKWRDSHELDRLQDMNCFSADTSLETAVGLMGVKAGDADMVFISNYQSRWQSSRLTANYDHVRDETPDFDPTKVIIPFTHDWGQCIIFDWNLWIIRERIGLKIDPVVRSTTAWTVMADLNSPCYRPHQDVVIPPRTCASKEIFDSFEDMAKVRPARERKILSAFGGTIWGTGAVTRQKLFCVRMDTQQMMTLPSKKLNTPNDLMTLYNRRGSYPTFAAINNDTIFCPQPAGTTGWATRLVDSMYAGCIPVFIGHSAQYPFFDMIDWSKISVRIEPWEIDQIEELLLERYTLDDVERMQANIMLIRDALVYPLDDVSDEKRMEMMLDRRGPLFFALYSTGMRMATKWPVDNSVDEP